MRRCDLGKKISHEKCQARLSAEIRYFFYISNDWEKDAEEMIFGANARCNKENLLARLGGGVRALSAPVDNLLGNWAYMVMTVLAIFMDMSDYLLKIDNH